MATSTTHSHMTAVYTPNHKHQHHDIPSIYFCTKHVVPFSMHREQRNKGKRAQRIGITVKEGVAVHGCGTKIVNHIRK